MNYERKNTSYIRLCNLDVYYFICMWEWVEITQRFSDLSLAPGNSSKIPFCKKLGHSCTRHLTVPCGLSLIDNIIRGTSLREGEWQSDQDPQLQEGAVVGGVRQRLELGSVRHLSMCVYNTRGIHVHLCVYVNIVNTGCTHIMYKGLHSCGHKVKGHKESVGCFDWD